MTLAHVFQLLGLIYLAIGAGIGFNQDYGRRLVEGFFDCAAATMVAGIGATVAGFCLVVFYAGTSDAGSIMAGVIGWAALLKGLLVLMLPNFLESWARRWAKNPGNIAVTAVLAIVFGLVMSYVGFFVI